MIKRIKTIFLSVSLVAALISAVFTAVISDGNITAGNIAFAEAEIKSADFFEAYYSTDGSSGARKIFSDYWDYEDGKLTRIDNSAVNTNGNTATLIFKDQFVQDFEISFDYLSDTNGYTGAFGKVRKGAYGANAAANGLTAYVKSDGTAVIEGRYDMGTKVEKKILNYDPSVVHSYKLRYLCQTAVLFMDGEEILSMQNITCSIPLGAVGLQSVNTKSVIENLKYSELDFFGEPVEYKDGIFNIACVGDSITYGAGATGVDGEFDQSLSYVGLLKKALGKNFNVKDFGLGMRTIMKDKTYSFWKDMEFEESFNYPYDIVIIMMGSNDANYMNWVGDDPMGGFRNSYNELIDLYKAANPDAKIYVMSTPAPESTYSEDILSRTFIINSLVPAEKEIATNKGCGYIDICKVTQAFTQSDYADGLHPSNAGYVKIAQTVYTQLANDFGNDFTLGENSIELAVGAEYKVIHNSILVPSFTSSNTQVATVSSDGLVSANTAGSSVIVVKAGKYTKNLVVRVKQAPSVTNVSYSGQLRYGDSLPELTYTSDVSGTLSFADGIVLITGENEYDWVFVPEDASKYAQITGRVALTILKARTVKQAPIIADVEWRDGIKLGDIELPDGFAWKLPESTLKAGANEFEAVFVPTDSENYESLTFTLEFNVKKNEPADTNDGCGGALTGTPFVLLSFVLMFTVAVIIKRRSADED